MLPAQFHLWYNMSYRLALAWAGQPVDHKALLLIIAILIAMGLTLLGLVLVARDTNILSCFVWSRGRVTNSRSQGIRFKSGAARLTSPEETLILMVTYVESGMCWLKQMFPSWARGRETNCPRQFKWFKRKYWEINSDGHYATCTISSVIQHVL